MEQEQFEQVKQKMLNMYSYLDKLDRYYEGESNIIRELKGQYEIIYRGMDFQLDAATKLSAKNFNQQLLTWDILNKLLKVQENYIYAKECVEKETCSEKNALDFMNQSYVDLISDAGKGLMALQDEQLKALIFGMGQKAIIDNFGFDDSQTQPDNPLQLINNDERAELRKAEVVEQRDNKRIMIESAMDSLKWLEVGFDEEIKSLEGCTNQIVEILNITPVDTEELNNCKYKLSEIETNIRTINNNRAYLDDNNENLANSLIQEDNVATEEIYKIGMIDSMQRLASLSERASILKTIDKNRFIDFCSSSLKACGYLYHEGDVEIYEEIDKCCARITKANESNNNSENE